MHSNKYTSILYHLILYFILEAKTFSKWKDTTGTFRRKSINIKIKTIWCFLTLDEQSQMHAFQIFCCCKSSCTTKFIRSIFVSYDINKNYNGCFCICYNKQLLDEVFVICRIINVEVRVISRAEGEADNFFRDIDNFAYHKNRVQ